MKKNVAKTKAGRNDPCPCGSGLKYKRCCMVPVQRKHIADIPELYWRRHRIRLKSEKDVAAIRRAGDLVIQTLSLVESRLRPGMTTDEVNIIVHDFTVSNGAMPAPLHYRGFPKSSCVSVNEVICHGVPGGRVMKDGDIVNVDVTSILEGYYADANKTFFLGTPGPGAQKIVSVARECLKRGLEMVKPGNTIGDIGWAIQSYAEGERCSVVREFVGHGVGLDFHEAPQVPHYGKQGDGIILVPGMVFTVEPMINLGGRDVRVLADDWTAVTRDGSLSAQFEQTVLVTATGCESLTPYDL